MDARLERVLDNVRHNPSFVCNPAKSALAREALVTPDSFDPNSDTLAERVRGTMQRLFTGQDMEGAIMVSTADPNGGGVLDLAPTVAEIALEVRNATQRISGLGQVDQWENIVKGKYEGMTVMRWEDPSLAEAWSGPKHKSDISEGISVSAHGPIYPVHHPRYQPHPAIAVVRLSSTRRMTDTAAQAIVEKAHAGAGRHYVSTTYLLPLK